MGLGSGDCGEERDIEVKTVSMKARFWLFIPGDETRDGGEESATNIEEELGLVGQARSCPRAAAVESELESARAAVEQTDCHKLDKSL